MGYLLLESGDKILIEETVDSYLLLEADDTTAIAARVTKALEREWTDKVPIRIYTDKTQGG